MLEVGWPDPAAVLDRIESTRSCWASSGGQGEIDLGDGRRHGNLHDIAR